MCGGLPFGYKAAEEQKDLESFEVVGRKTKAGMGEIVRSRGGKVRVRVSGWWTGGVE